MINNECIIVFNYIIFHVMISNEYSKDSIDSKDSDNSKITLYMLHLCKI